MKVLFVISDSTAHGGTEILAFNLIQELQRLGVECYLLSRYIYEGDNPRVLNMNQSEIIQYNRLLKNPLNKLLGCKFSDAFFKSVVRRKAAELKVDWIVNHTYDLCSAIPTNGRWRTAQVFHWSIVGYEDFLRSLIRKKSVFVSLFLYCSLKASIKRWHRAIPHFNRLISLTVAAYPEIQYAGGLATQKNICQIPDPLTHSQESDVLSSLENNTVVYVGRLSQEKGVMRLLRMWKHISVRLSEYTLKIYGDGHLKDEMVKYITANQISRVKLMGFTYDKKDLYTNADLCLMTSDTEGFGMVLIEAMYYGVPCISFDCPISPKEIIADAGVTVPCFDENAYENAVIEMLSHKDRLHVLQQKAVERAKDFYMDKVLRAWLQVLNSKEE